MFLELAPAELALQEELRAYFARLLPPDRRAELGWGENSDLARDIVRQLGRDGWLGIGWATEFGGQGRPPMDQFIFFQEAQRAGVPIPLVTLNTVGPTIMKYGSDEQKAYFLPRILAGELAVAIGYTEPDAGTDLASLSTRAVLDGDEYVVTGSKVFTSGAHDADYIWLAARTDPDAPKHRGISILLVPTDAPGFRVTPIHTVGDIRTNATFYDGVRVPVANRVGPEHGGWRMITTQLNHERVALAALGGLAHRLWEEVADWARSTAVPEGGSVFDLPWVRTELATAFARLEAMKLLNWRLVGDTAAGTLNPADASAAKVLGTESVVEVYRSLLAVLGPYGTARVGTAGAVLGGEVERAARAAQINTFGGGVNEVQREIVATLGLGLPRPHR